jgi:hypothetical protein
MLGPGVSWHMDTVDKTKILNEIQEIRNLVLNSMQQGLQQPTGGPPPVRTLYLF